MARETHIHLHLHAGMFGAQSTADAGTFSEEKHKRSGGQFATSSGTSRVNVPATGAAAYAAKHSKEAVEAARAAAHQKNKEENMML